MEALANLDSGICRSAFKTPKVNGISRVILKQTRSLRGAQNDFRNRESRCFTVCEVHSKEGSVLETGVVILFAPCAANPILPVSGRNTSACTASRAPGQFIWRARSSVGHCLLQRLRCSDGGGLRWRFLFRMRWRGFHIFLWSITSRRRSSIRCGRGGRIRKWWR
jgi:hypothetical protein